MGGKCARRDQNHEARRLFIVAPSANKRAKAAVTKRQPQRQAPMARRAAMVSRPPRSGSEAIAGQRRRQSAGMREA